MPQLRVDLTGNDAIVRTETQSMRDMPIPGAEAGKIEVVPESTTYLTEQTVPPIQVGSIRGLFGGIANAIVAGAGAAVAVLVADGSDRQAILSGLALGLTLLGTTISGYTGFAYADQVSRAKKV